MNKDYRDDGYEKAYMMDNFLKNLPDTYLGIKKIEK